VICHISRHRRSTFANPRNSRNLRRCPLVSNKRLTAVLALRNVSGYSSDICTLWRSKVTATDRSSPIAAHIAPAGDAAARATPGAGLVVVVLLSLGLWAATWLAICFLAEAWFG
jgi:hypothetical protein